MMSNIIQFSKYYSAKKLSKNENSQTKEDLNDLSYKNLIDVLNILADKHLSSEQEQNNLKN